MPRVIARIGNREIISSGSLLFWMNEQAEIYPFDDDDKFYVIIKTAFSSENNKLGTNLEINSDGVIFITYNRSVNYNGLSGNMSTLIAHDETYKYMLSFTIDTLGTSEKKAIQMVYSVSRIRNDV